MTKFSEITIRPWNLYKLSVRLTIAHFYYEGRHFGEGYTKIADTILCYTKHPGMYEIIPDEFGWCTETYIELHKFMGLRLGEVIRPGANGGITVMTHIDYHLKTLWVKQKATITAESFNDLHKFAYWDEDSAEIKQAEEAARRFAAKYNLKPREEETCVLLAMGYNTAQIAQITGKTKKAIQARIRLIRGKAGAKQAQYTHVN